MTCYRRRPARRQRRTHDVAERVSGSRSRHPSGRTELRVPKLRQGSCFPGFPEAAEFSQQALVAVIREARIDGVPTRQVDEPLQAMGLGGVLNRPLFASMRADATFINTGRGRQVNEADLAAVLAERPDLTALLDVTDPEPPAPDSPFYALPNVHLTSHIAGASNDEVLRMADTMIEEYQRWVDGQPLRYAVTQAMLARMA